MATPATPAERAAHAARVKALPLAFLYKQGLTKASFWCGQAAAEELVQAALTRLVRAGANEWDHAADPTAWSYLCHAMNESRKNARRMAARRRTDLDSEQVDEAPPSSDRAASRGVLDREEATWARAELLRRLAKWPLAVRVVEACISEGEMTPAELAEHLGVDVKALYTTNERIKTEVGRVRAAWVSRNEAPAV